MGRGARLGGWVFSPSVSPNEWLGWTGKRKRWRGRATAHHHALLHNVNPTASPLMPPLTCLHHALGALNAALRGQAVHEARLGARRPHQVLIHLRGGRWVDVRD